MIDSFGAAAQCAEEALRDPGGLRFAHVPSLVAFVSGLRTGGDCGPAWDAGELAQGVRLDRLLWELGLREEANRLFDVLAERVQSAPEGAAHALELHNSLAVVALALGLPHRARHLLRTVSADAAGLLGTITWINRAVVELSLGDTGSARIASLVARARLAALDAERSAEPDEVLATVELRLAVLDGHRAAGGGDRLPAQPEPVAARGDARLGQLAHRATTFVREAGEDDPRAFLSVAGFALARIAAALRDQDLEALTTSVHVLEVASQRLSAMLGADHPQVLGVRADLAAVHVESARVTRSADRLERALVRLASVSERLDARLGPEHPRSVAALTNLVTAQVDSVRATGEAERAVRAERTADELAEQARRAERRLGERHPVTRLMRASSQTCRRIASRGDAPWNSGSTLLMTLTEAPHGWATDAGAYRSFDEAVERLSTRGTARAFGRPLVPGHTARRMRMLLGVGRAAPAAGQIVPGTVAAFRPEGVVLSLDHGTGFVPASELSLRGGACRLAAGQHVEAMTLGRRDAEGRAVMSVRRARAERAWDSLAHLGGTGGEVSGTVIEAVRGGLVVDVGLRAFLPAGLADCGQGADLGDVVGAELKARIGELDRRRGLVVLTRREQAEQVPTRGRRDRVPVRVRQLWTVRAVKVSPRGVLVEEADAPHRRGLILRTELSWLHVEDPAHFVGVGEMLRARVVGRDSGTGLWLLSLRAAHDDPWRAFTLVHRPGEIIEATVVKALAGGVLVRVEDGIDALVRRRSAPGDREGTARDGVMPPDERVFVALTGIGHEHQRLSFSFEEADAVGVEDGEPNPVRYGMGAYCDSRGELMLPDGYDEEAGVWLPGYEDQREYWEGMFTEMTERCLRHRAWVAERQRRRRTTGT
ncbi:hypothetical protein GCM10009601_23150 [Streptomyces thermospinosisporus]|uniref:S1 motif domain-containing protein n=1 Tax=Streptomyces thermospinosisporus TaxID=161482 RepID=A0ABP4JHI0_9ACTN